ncbi:MAG TPA: alpha/beta hydrolase [Acetobacteraceae bacterium]|jgi:pimeloyl-ACP methyl ester carboxylesterase|nr:alpha/beta hydrolase [Acetobacteraceae bacterium]
MDLLPVAGDGAVSRRRGFLERDAARLYWEATGDGPALVFAHGLGGSHLSWWQQVAAFADRFTCVAFAHRGFLPSRDAVVPRGPAAFTEDLLALLDHLALPDAVLVAQSMGGWTCLEAALRAPRRVRALVMSATSGTIDPGRVTELGDWRARAEAEVARGMLRGVHPAMGARAASEQPALHLLYRHFDDSAGIADKEAMRAALGALRVRGPEAVDALAMPVLWLAGAEDVVFPPAAAVALAERMGTQAEIIPETGHSPYFERAAAFNTALARFVG